MERETKGFIFINENGCYARQYISNSGFAKPSVRIEWVQDMNHAEVFPHEAMARRKFEELKSSQVQSLKAVEIKTIRLKVWEELTEKKNEVPS